MRIILLAVMLLLVLAAVSCAERPGAQPSQIANPVDAGPTWIKIYADEDWYRSNTTPEQHFVGMLTRVSAPEASTQLWAHRYKLDNRYIYPGEQNAALDKLAGQRVEIRGKMSDVNFGEQRPNEIWPAAIRPSPNPS